MLYHVFKFLHYMLRDVLYIFLSFLWIKRLIKKSPPFSDDKLTHHEDINTLYKSNLGILPSNTNMYTISFLEIYTVCPKNRIRNVLPSCTFFRKLQWSFSAIIERVAREDS